MSLRFAALSILALSPATLSPAPTAAAPEAADPARQSVEAAIDASLTRYLDGRAPIYVGALQIEPAAGAALAEGAQAELPVVGVHYDRGDVVGIHLADGDHGASIFPEPGGSDLLTHGLIEAASIVGAALPDGALPADLLTAPELSLTATIVEIQSGEFLPDAPALGALTLSARRLDPGEITWAHLVAADRAAPEAGLALARAIEQGRAQDLGDRWLITGATEIALESREGLDADPSCSTWYTYWRGFEAEWSVSIPKADPARAEIVSLQRGPEHEREQCSW